MARILARQIVPRSEKVMFLREGRGKEETRVRKMSPKERPVVESGFAANNGDLRGRISAYRLKSRVRRYVLCSKDRQKPSQSGAATVDDGESKRHLMWTASGSLPSISRICLSKRFQSLTTSAIATEERKSAGWRGGNERRKF